MCTVVTDAEQPVKEMVEFTVIYNKQKYEVKFALDETVDALKNHIEKLTGNLKVLYSVTTCCTHSSCSSCDSNSMSVRVSPT